MDTTASARLGILAVALHALAKALPPDVAADALDALHQQVSTLPRVNADADAARAGELQSLLDALAR